MATAEAGTCSIKPEYILLPEKDREITLECVSSGDKRKIDELNESVDTETSEEPSKKKKWSKKENKKLRGQNKSRGPTFTVNKTIEICYNLIGMEEGGEKMECKQKNCPFLHSVDEYLKLKPEDIGEECYNYRTWGKCSRGLSCRFGSEHIINGNNHINEELMKTKGPQELATKNNFSHDLQVSLRKRLYDFDMSAALIKYNDLTNKKQGCGPKSEKESKIEHTPGEEVKPKLAGNITDEDIIKLSQREKKTIDWRDKLFLSPLTTVGNLPFRRICKEFGADITCGEMAMCSSLLQGKRQEWALVKRHHTEDIFGVQLCANNPHLLTRCGQLLQEKMDVDFIDLNLGCPIEMVYQEGGGSGLLRRGKVLESCIKNLSQILTIPLTIKTRTGVYNNNNIAHDLAPKFRDWGASLLTIHGRSREQRYTKSADWQYIRQVALAAAPLPVLGNGDILSYEDYSLARETCPELAGVMIGRGALIKPWIFTEIKEQKLWDISSSDRLDIIKKYVNYGLEHWGSDNKGVENTRRFLLEWLSFLYRYVPVGILERPPQKINERPPFYKGRDDLETLMASPSAVDWIKISEMLLGRVPENFHFLPKHKANSYK